MAVVCFLLALDKTVYSAASLCFLSQAISSACGFLHLGYRCALPSAESFLDFYSQASHCVHTQDCFAITKLSLKSIVSVARLSGG